MLFAFRKIRKSLLKSNKIINYLLYAIGEIVLVVIGIIIAVQINNANTREVNNQTFYNYMSEIKNDLARDTMTFNAGIGRNNEKVREHTQTLRLLNRQKLPFDSIANNMTTHYIDVYQHSVSSYQKLTSSGLAVPTSFDSLVNRLNTYYTVEISSYRGFVEWNRTLTDQYYNKIYYENAVSELPFSGIENISGSKPSEKEIEARFRSMSFRNLIVGDLYAKNNSKEEMRKQKKMAIDLIMMIDQKLESVDYQD